jgi:hypothetical protein
MRSSSLLPSHPQRISHTIDVVEEARDQRDLENTSH